VTGPRVWEQYVSRDDAGQLELSVPLTHPFADLGTSRCEHESVRGNRCTNSGEWDGLSGRVLCTEHANGVDS
jgi:hypothetical protein